MAGKKLGLNTPQTVKVIQFSKVNIRCVDIDTENNLAKIHYDIIDDTQVPEVVIQRKVDEFAGSAYDAIVQTNTAPPGPLGDKILDAGYQALQNRYGWTGDIL